MNCVSDEVTNRGAPTKPQKRDHMTFKKKSSAFESRALRVET